MYKPEKQFELSTPCFIHPRNYTQLGAPFFRNYTLVFVSGLGSSSQLRRSSSQLKPAPGEIESLKPVSNEKLSKKGSDIFKKSNSNLSEKKTAVKNGIGRSSSSPVRPLTGPANHSPVRTKSPAPVKPVPSDKGTSAEAESIEVMEVKGKQKYYAVLRDY